MLDLMSCWLFFARHRCITLPILLTDLAVGRCSFQVSSPELPWRQWCGGFFFLLSSAWLGSKVRCDVVEGVGCCCPDLFCCGNWVGLPLSGHLGSSRVISLGALKLSFSL